jgi:hypothetical protein
VSSDLLALFNGEVERVKGIRSWHQGARRLAHPLVPREWMKPDDSDLGRSTSGGTSASASC